MSLCIFRSKLIKLYVLCAVGKFWRECSFGGMQLWVKLATLRLCRDHLYHTEIAIFALRLVLEAV